MNELSALPDHLKHPVGPTGPVGPAGPSLLDEVYNRIVDDLCKMELAERRKYEREHRILLRLRRVEPWLWGAVAIFALIAIISKLAVMWQWWHNGSVG